MTTEARCGQGVPPCGFTDDVHPYLTGPACPRHTPAALAGWSEAWGQDQGRLPGAYPFVFRPSDTALNDERARNSGKRATRQQRAGARA